MGYYAPFNWIDVAIIGALIIGSAVGFVQGLLRLLFAAAASYIAFILAAQYFHVVGVWLSGLFVTASDVALDSVGFTVIFIVAQVGVNGLGHSTYRNTHLARIGVLDQLGGSIIGLALSFVIVSTILLILNFAVKTPWVGIEGIKRTITDAAAASTLMPMFLAAIPGIAETARPWLPAPLPSLFYL